MTRHLRILVADDDYDHAQSLSELLELEGHQTEIAKSGEIAAEAFATGTHDIAFVDATLPGRDSLESFLDIRKANATAQSYMMSGNSIEQVVQRAANGGLEVIRWPTTPERVLTALRDAGPIGIVLIAEGEPSAGADLLYTLSEADYAVKHITEANDALDTADDRRVHVLLFDLKSSVIDALSVYRSLRAAGRGKPSIILAGRRNETATFDDVAVTGILAKPFDPRLLLERLEELAA